MFDADVDLGREFCELNLADLRVGSLVLDSCNNIIQIRSIEAIKIEYESGTFGKTPFYYGYINGENSANFKSCPITRGLLRDLEWITKEHKDDGYVVMYPPLSNLPYFVNADEQFAFPVFFTLRNENKLGYPKGFKLIYSTGSEDLLELEHMHWLDAYFYECFKVRMRMDIKEYQSIAIEEELEFNEPPSDLACPEINPL